MKMYRQGDLLFRKVDSIPKRARKNSSPIILEGEATGHAHQIENGAIFDHWENMFIKADQGAVVVHEEHASLNLEEGNYIVIRQREYVSGRRTGSNSLARGSRFRYVRD
ncbi:MAG: hypothetical protein ACFFBD_21775 [Candidatus Hodarchaeota archaeon]